MTDVKRFYWLKLKEDFFRQKEVKMLRELAGGDVHTIIYLKMLLLSLADDGKLYYEGIAQDFAAEIALDIDEKPENVRLTVAFLMAKGILIQTNEAEWKVITAKEMTGSECESARRMRRMRQAKALVSPEKPLLASQSDSDVTKSDVEKEIKKEIRDKSKSKKKGVFTPPTVEEVTLYANEKGYSRRELNPEYFVNFYESKGWMVGKGKMSNWKAAANGWVARYREQHPNGSWSDREVANEPPRRDISELKIAPCGTDILQKALGDEDDDI